MANWKKIIVSGSDAELNSLQVAGAVSASGFDGTGSYASYALTASYALNVPGVDPSASWASQSLSASYVPAAGVDGTVASAFTASYLVGGIESSSWASQSLSASYAGNASTADQALSSYTASYVLGTGVDGTVASAHTASYVLNAQTASFVASASHAVNADTASYIGTVSGPVTVDSDLTVRGNLVVDGTASFQNAENLNVKDQFILLSSGSATIQDSGIIVASGSNAGVAIYLETASTGGKGRWAVASNVGAGDVSATAEEFVMTVEKSVSAPAQPAYGESANGFGNVHIDSATGDIYIFS